jgi:hypothetical protein
LKNHRIWSDPISISKSMSHEMVIVELLGGVVPNRFLGFAPKKHVNLSLKNLRLEVVIPTGVMRSIM